MTLASEMERLSQEIADLKVLRKKEVEDLSRGNKNMLNDFNNKRKSMAKELKEERAQEKTARLKDCQDRKESVRKLLKNLSNEHKVMAEELKEKAKKVEETLSRGEKDRLEDYYKIMESIQEFVEQLKKGEEKRKENVHLFLNELQDDREKMAQYWRSIATLKKEIKKEDMPYQFEEKYESKAAPVSKEEIEEFEPEKPLEERVLNYINAHSEGVSVGDMEAPLGVVRMQLGKVAKELLEEGKVNRIDKKYYPI